MYKKIIFLLVVISISGCDYIPTLDDVIPDRRTEYKRSETMPDLEVPPDLTTEALDDPLIIPDEEATTLSAFERQKIRRRSGNLSEADLMGAGGLDAEQWLSVQGSSIETWPKLREFWANKGYSLDLDDAELGVMETDWLESDSDGIVILRNKFKIFSEPGKEAGSTLLFISSERQEKIIGDGDSVTWVNIEEDIDLNKEIVGELNLHFYGKILSSGGSSGSTSRTASTGNQTVERKQAEMLKLDEDKVYLSLPEEFSLAWAQAEDALIKAGLLIENQDKSKGLYYVLYYPDVGEDEEGLLSKLKFWEDDEPEGEEYQVSLTGVGDKTELVVLNSDGDWADYKNASRILTLLQAQYNNSTR